MISPCRRPFRIAGESRDWFSRCSEQPWRDALIESRPGQPSWHSRRKGKASRHSSNTTPLVGSMLRRKQVEDRQGRPPQGTALPPRPWEPASGQQRARSSAPRRDMPEAVPRSEPGQGCWQERFWEPLPVAMRRPRRRAGTTSHTPSVWPLTANRFRCHPPLLQRCMWHHHRASYTYRRQSTRCRHDPPSQ